MIQTDFIVIGGGIAGASVAALLAEQAGVVLIEAESQPGFHSTGRSAAYFAPAYGNSVVRNLTAVGSHFFRSPPDGFSVTPLLRERGAMFVARADQQESVRAMVAENAALAPLDAAQMIAHVPILKPDVAACGLFDESGGDLDVDAILQGYLKRLRAAGGQIVTGTRVISLTRSKGIWTANDSVRAPVVVNAAGAWADEIAKIAGLDPLGLVPKRRTALLVDAPTDLDIENWPLTIGIDEDFYFKPDAGKLLISPADETPSAPCDAQPEEIDVAIAIDRVQAIADLSVRTVRSRWAGLRTFAPDKTFVAGFDQRAEGFFWLAGQGGYGVQSAPGLSSLAWHLLTGGSLEQNYASVIDSAHAVDPSRLIQ